MEGLVFIAIVIHSGYSYSTVNIKQIPLLRIQVHLWKHRIKEWKEGKSSSENRWCRYINISAWLSDFKLDLHSQVTINFNSKMRNSSANILLPWQYPGFWQKEIADISRLKHFRMHEDVFSDVSILKIIFILTCRSFFGVCWKFWTQRPRRALREKFQQWQIEKQHWTEKSPGLCSSLVLP